MESIYYVISYPCHRTCVHCYEDRFRPYQGEELQAQVDLSQSVFPRVIGHFPPSMLYRDGERERTGTVILAGGEVLLPAVREPVLYPALDQLRRKYEGAGGVRLVVQTTGDLVTPEIVRELLSLGVWTISVAGIDHFHKGLEEETARERLKQKLTAMFEDAGMREFAAVAAEARDAEGAGPFYQFFGATPELWIGKIWPRGRAMANELSSAGLADNFCAQWSGGIHFLEAGRKGAEVSIEPDGGVYPCCLKTRLPVGNAAEEPLLNILSRLRGNPVYEAINAGRPQEMGLEHGWSVEEFVRRSRTLLPSGRVYENLCVGCDRFHDEVLGKIRT
jgi:hypothetical protein